MFKITCSLGSEIKRKFKTERDAFIYGKKSGRNFIIWLDQFNCEKVLEWSPKSGIARHLSRKTVKERLKKLNLNERVTKLESIVDKSDAVDALTYANGPYNGNYHYHAFFQRPGIGAYSRIESLEGNSNTEAYIYNGTDAERSLQSGLEARPSGWATRGSQHVQAAPLADYPVSSIEYDFDDYDEFDDGEFV